MKMTDLWSLYEADKRILVKGYYFAMIDDYPRMDITGYWKSIRYLLLMLSEC